MRKTLLLLTLFVGSSLTVLAQDSPQAAPAATPDSAVVAAKPANPFGALKRRYINVGYMSQKMAPAESGESISDETMKSKDGGVVEFGTTYILNRKKPSAEKFLIGLDWSYLDLSYASFKLDGTDDEGKPITSSFANVGMQIGPSIIFPLAKEVYARAYLHYAPSFAVLVNSTADAGMLGYAGYVTGGAQISYRWFGAGFEVRGGNGTLTYLAKEGDSVEMEADNKVKLPGVRFIVGFS